GYGHLALSLILNLEKLSLLKYRAESNKSKNLVDLCKNFKLLHPPSSSSMLYNNYTPLSCKLIEYFINESLSDVAPRILNESLKHIPGQSICVSQNTNNLHNLKRILIS
ncbi:hypothetical protein MXB_1955, partial [Myxobolus squamalis]